ncbi:hypothetical protein GCM10009798_15920 [Nocardioides panacihumi]|uniref:Cyanophycinase n=1 Tax=Nocardioides panacihumi TaxID=400774 RepID=A0ABN2QSK2_9ACTN
MPVDTTENAFPGDAYGPAAADRATVAREVRRSTGVFFGGGDQMDYVRTLQHCRPAPLEAFTHCTPSAVLSAVGDLLDEGGVVAGVSAGTTIQQGADMITGGESYEAWRDGATPGYLDDPAALGYLPSGGFGFFSGAMLDSHFTTWGRQARMIRLAADTGHRHVIGIDETTALVVRRQSRQAEVIGRHGVSILEVTPRTTGWTYLTAGDRVDLRTWKVRPAPHSSALVGTGPAAAPVVDVWDSATADEPGSYTLRNLAVDLVHSTAREASGTTYEDGPRYRTVLRRTSATSAWEHGNVTSFADLELDIATTG